MKAFLLLMSIIFMFSTVSYAENEPIEEMPYVFLGGNTLFIDYTNESFAYYAEAENADSLDLIETDYNVVQIGNIPILYVPDIEIASKVYNGQYVDIKELLNGKLHYRRIFIPKTANYEKNYRYDSSTSGKVCFYIPESNTALLFAHPISSGNCGGVVYDAKVIGMIDGQYSIYSEKYPSGDSNVVGIITGQNNYGITIQFDPNRMNFDEHRKIQIARKDEVHLGKAYIYTDYGKGLDFYEIEITSLFGEVIDEDFNEETLYESTPENDPIIGNRFLFSFTDQRFIDDEITYSVPGMSGSPIIQDDKLIGMNGYYEFRGGIAVYAQSAYEETISYQTISHQKYQIKTSKTGNPVILLGNYCASMYMKEIGTYITKIDGESYGLMLYDRVIAIDNNTLFVGINLTNYIKKKHEETKKPLKLTVLRNKNEIIDIYLDVNQNPILTNYNYNNIATGYVSMIDPISFRYAIGAFKNITNLRGPFSGITWRGLIDLPDDDIPTGVSFNNITGTITNIDSQAYGFLEPFIFDESRLIEIATWKEIENGPAVIYIYDGDYNNYLFKVNIIIEKKDTYIQLSLVDGDDYITSFEYCNISGLPIIQKGKLVGIYATHDKDVTKAKAYYAIQVYKEMMNVE